MLHPYMQWATGASPPFGIGMPSLGSSRLQPCLTAFSARNTWVLPHYPSSLHVNQWVPRPNPPFQHRMPRRPPRKKLPIVAVTPRPCPPPKTIHPLLLHLRRSPARPGPVVVIAKNPRKPPRTLRRARNPISPFRPSRRPIAPPRHRILPARPPPKKMRVSGPPAFVVSNALLPLLVVKAMPRQHVSPRTPRTGTEIGRVTKSNNELRNYFPQD